MCNFAQKPSLFMKKTNFKQLNLTNTKLSTMVYIKIKNIKQKLSY